MTVIRDLHVLLAFLTVAGFALRGALSLIDSPLLERRWMRIAPHFIDTMLLAFGITLAVRYRIGPLEHGWLGAKILVLLVYIGLGITTMRARRRSVKLIAYPGALFAAGYIIAIAYTRQAVPF